MGGSVVPGLQLQLQGVLGFAYPIVLLDVGLAQDILEVVLARERQWNLELVRMAYLSLIVQVRVDHAILSKHVVDK